MKLKYEFALSESIGLWSAVAIGEGSKHYRSVIVMNETAKDIFELIREGLDEEQIIEKMLHMYDVEEGQVRSEAHALIEKLQNDGLFA